MRVLLIGGFRKTKHLANSLLKKGYKVTAINADPQNSKSLAEIDRLAVFCGDGTKPFVLEDASAHNADIAIALTKYDADNLVICELCKKKFRVKRTVALISDPKKTRFFYRMGIDSVVCATTAISSIIEQQAFLDEISTLVPVGEGRVKIAQVPIPAAAPAVDKKLMELRLPRQVIIGCIMRGENSMIPRGDTQILAGDVLVLISSGDDESAALQALLGRQ
jgi:K+ transport systems, NAD-binding component